MCMYVTEVPTSARAGLVWPCWKMLIRPQAASSRFRTSGLSFLVPRDGWLFPDRRSAIAVWYYRRVANGGVIHAYTYRPALLGGVTVHSAWAVGVLAFGYYGDLIARAVFIPHVAREADRRLAHRTESLLSRIADGHCGRRELFELHPQLRYAVTGKR